MRGKSTGSRGSLTTTPGHLSELIGFIKAYRTEHSYGPTVDECATAMNLRSKSTANEIINKAIAAGILRRDIGVARSLDLKETI